MKRHTNTAKAHFPTCKPALRLPDLYRLVAVRLPATQFPFAVLGEGKEKSPVTGLFSMKSRRGRGEICASADEIASR